MSPTEGPPASAVDESQIDLISYIIPFRRPDGPQKESSQISSKQNRRFRKPEEPKPKPENPKWPEKAADKKASTFSALDDIVTAEEEEIRTSKIGLSNPEIETFEGETKEDVIEIVIPDQQEPPVIRLGLSSDVEKDEFETFGGGAAEDETEEQDEIEAFEGLTKIRHLKLYRAAIIGDWITAASLYERYPDDISAVISKQWGTALHVAAAANKNSFVKELVKRMQVEDLAIKNRVGLTALHYAASSGNLEIAKVLIMNCKQLQLANIQRRSNDYMLPLHMAALSGHKATVDFLHRETNFDNLKDQDKVELLVASIYGDLYDYALELFERYPKLALLRDSNGETALHVLTRKPITSFNLADRSPQTMVERFFKPFSCTNVDHSLRLALSATKLVERIWKQVKLLDDQQISQLIGTPWPLVFVAAEKGNFVLLSVLIRESPDPLCTFDKYERSIFHIAVLNRHEKIFNLFHEIGPLKDMIVSHRDHEGNTILHLAGMLPGTNCLNVVSGAAFQMQEELFWFNEVSKIVRPSNATVVNCYNKTARDLFVESHRELKKESEMWMKDAANSCMVVAALVTTVVFAAVLTVPGGNKEDTGAPKFLKEVSFKIFAMANSISLLFSTISIHSFLSILTATFAKEELLWRRNKNFVVGLTSLFISIGAIIIVFATASFIVLKDEMAWFPILVTGLAVLPVLLFSWHHRLVFELLILFYFPAKGKRNPYMKEVY